MTMRKLLLTLALLPLQASAQRELLLDGSLSDDEAAARPFVYNNFRDAVAHFADTTTLYVRPGVYWVDDPDQPEVVRGENGREPFGCVIRGKVLRLVGLDADARNTVFASARGQMQGAVGNFTMFDIYCDSLQVENLTLGNFCNVDLDYPLNPALSRKKRSDAITQAHVGYVHGRSLLAKNVRFISRLNLNPLNGATESYYEDCHFECTDDALNGTAVYRHCDFDLYGQKPFWSTFGRGAMFIDCDFYLKGPSRAMFFCKQGGPVTVVDCRYHAPDDSIYIGWTAYPQRWLRCYQGGFTLNGKPYVIGHRHPENTVLMSPMLQQRCSATLQPPFLAISRHEADLRSPATLTLSSDSDATWRMEPGYESFASLTQTSGGKATFTLTNETNENAAFCIVATTADGREAASHIVLKPSLLSPPALLRKPRISRRADSLLLDYRLDLQGCRDESRITWQRDGIVVSTTHDAPQRTYHLTEADAGCTITAVIEPKSSRSDYGSATSVTLKAKRQKRIDSLSTDFHDFPCQWQPEVIEGYWTVDGYKPADTDAYDWRFDRNRPMWEYGEGFNGAVGKGLLQAQRGARLRYTPVKRTYNNMSLTLNVDPTKTAGQGFGSATGQYMDVCLKFDTRSLTGYGLRIVRTAKHAKAVDFLLVEYKDGVVTPLTDPVSATCYRTGCTIALSYADGRLTASVETTTPRPADGTLPHAVSLSAPVASNPFGGIHIQHTGSCGESTTMLHRLHAAWAEM